MVGSLLAFAVAAGTFVLLIFALSYAVDTAQEGVVGRLRSGAPTVKRWGGYILVMVGVWFIALGVFAAFFSGIFPV
jgi:protein-S-isoprenylcysteine O-methyltransferase Ste14